MIFNSPIFLFGFLPSLGIILYLLYKFKLNSLLIPTLLVASIIFYSFSSILFAVILAFSIILNFAIGKRINQSANYKLNWLIGGIVLNVGYICIFKYTDILSFFIFEFGIADLQNSSLPLGVSFYSFTQMAYLFDQYEGAKLEKKLVNYSLFVGFFPVVSSGPIVQNEDVGKQFNELTFKNIKIEKVTRGGCLLLIGTFKKVVLADYLATFSNSVYLAIDNNIEVNFFEAWVGAISYSLQLYFDFSGYSDVAVGIALMIGINLPWNFNSPYKAVNIIDFWRRWHISLSTWLNNYIFEPVNYFVIKKMKTIFFFSKNVGLWGYLIGTFLTMLLCGLWHGATANFILWGLLNVAMIFANRFWKMLKTSIGSKTNATKKKLIPIWFYRYFTFVCVTFAWVLFRSSNLDSAVKLWDAMLGGNGIYLPDQIANKLGIILNNKASFIYFTTENHSVFSSFSKLSILINLGLLLSLVFFIPNSREIMFNQCKKIENPILFKIAKFFTIENGWSPSFFWILVMSVLMMSLFTWSKVPEFLYFNF
jgi:alginate O-acetyltransferase complex protein AlgI